MKALAEQIVDLDGVEIYGRVVGVRGLMVEVAGPIHAMSVGARLTIETGVRPGDPVRGGRLFRRPRAGHAVCRARRRAARLPRGGVDAPPARCARPSAGSAASSTRWASRSTGSGRCRRARALSVPHLAAAGACAPPGRRAARSRRARAQHLHHRLPRPAHGHLLRLRRRQVGAAVDAGAQRRRRRLGHRPGRRARPRGAGVLAGRSRPGRPGPLGGGRLDLRRAGVDAPPGGLSDARHRRISSATSARTCWC